jgi:hypothetical protein
MTRLLRITNRLAPNDFAAIANAKRQHILVRITIKQSNPDHIGRAGRAKRHSGNDNDTVSCFCESLPHGEFARTPRHIVNVMCEGREHPKQVLAG